MSHHVKLKADLVYDPRNQKADVSSIEKCVERMLNHPEETVVDVDIRVGRAAGAVFVTLTEERHKNPKNILKSTTYWMESEQYAPNIRIAEWYAEVTELPDPIEHEFEVDEYALDKDEPTPSPEANTVQVVELKDARAKEFEIEKTGKTVEEHNPTYPADDPVVVGRYPNMGGDKTFHFPESRLQKV